MGKLGQQETPLLRSFKTLHDHLQAVDDLADVDALTYLRPFLDVVHSADASGPITGIALQAINKFILYGLVREDTIGGKEAVNAVASAASKCKFESSSSSDDETTLMQLLELVENTVRCSAGRMLSGESVWEACETCFKISEMPRASHLLRATADAALSHVILTLFTRLPAMAIQASTSSNVPPMSEAEEGGGAAASGGGGGAAAAISAKAPRRLSLRMAGDSAVNTTQPYGASTPHGPSDLARILSWLAGLLDPRSHGAGQRLQGLRLVSMVLECSGQSMGNFPELVKVCQAELCRMLVQNSRSEEVGILSSTLRVVFNLFVSLKAHLKVPLEVFFTSVHLMLANSRTASSEQRELAIESLLEFAREPGMMLDMYVNYDCDVACTNLFEALCVCLGRNAVPRPSTPLTNLHVLSVEGILSIAEGLARRCRHDVSAPANQGGILGVGGTGVSLGGMAGDVLGHDDVEEAEAAAAAAAAAVDVATSAASRAGGSTADQKAVLAKLSARLEDLRRNKQVKRRMGQLAIRFNEVEGKHRKWVPFATDLGLLTDEPSPDDVAALLMRCHGMDKKWVGEYLAKPDEPKYAFESRVREAFTRQFDFASLRIDEALRHYLSTFRLPGEAQSIDRMMEAFATRFYEQTSDPLKKQDTAFILAFSIVMLNTDAHNPSIPPEKKMTLKGFLRNNSGIEDGQDVPSEYLTAIYESIQAREIAMPQGPTAVGGAGGVASKGGGGKGAAGGGDGDGNSGASDDDDKMEEADTGPGAPAIGKHWDGVLRRQGVASAYTDTAAATAQGGSLLLPAGEHERDMFQILVKPAIAAIQAVASATQDEATLVKCTQGLRHLASSAAYFVCTQALDDIVASTIFVARGAMHQILVIPASMCILPAGPVSLPMSAGRASPDPFALAAAYNQRQSSTGESTPALSGAGGMPPELQPGSKLVSQLSDSGTPDGSVAVDELQPLAAPLAASGNVPPTTVDSGAADRDTLEQKSDAQLALQAQAQALLATPGTPQPASSDDETGLPACPPARTPAMYLLRRALLLLRAALDLTATHCGGLRQSWKAVVALVLHMQKQDCLPGALVDEDDFTTPSGEPLPSARFTDTRFAAVRGADDDSEEDSIVDDADGFEASSVGQSSYGDESASVELEGGPEGQPSGLITSTRSVLSRRRRRDGQRAQPRRSVQAKQTGSALDSRTPSAAEHSAEIAGAHRPPRHPSSAEGADGGAGRGLDPGKESGGWLFTGIRSLFGLQQDTDDEEAEKHAVVAGSLAAEASRSEHGLPEIFGSTASRLPQDSLLSLMAALAEGYPQSVSAADDAAQAVLCLELGVAIALRNVWRSALVAPYVFESVRRGLFLHPCSFVPGEEPSITMEERMLPRGEPAGHRSAPSGGRAAPGDHVGAGPGVEWSLRTARPAWLREELRRVREYSGGSAFSSTDGLVWPGTAASPDATGGVGSGASGPAAGTSDDSEGGQAKAQLGVWLDEEARMERAHLVERAAVAAMRFSTRATEACDRHSAQTAARRAMMCLPSAGTATTIAGHTPAGPAVSVRVNQLLLRAMAPAVELEERGEPGTQGGAADAASVEATAGTSGQERNSAVSRASRSALEARPDIDRHVVPFLCLLQVLARPVADILAPRIAAGTGLLGSVAAGSTESTVFWRLVFDTLKGCTRNFYAAPLVWEALRRSVSPEVAKPRVCPDIIRTMLPLACPPMAPALGYAPKGAPANNEVEQMPVQSEYDTLLDFLLDEEAVGDLHDSQSAPIVLPVEDEAAVGLTAALVLEQRAQALLQARVAASRALGGVGVDAREARSGAGGDDDPALDLFGAAHQSRDLPAATIAATRAAQAACKVVFGQELEAARAHASAAMALARQRQRSLAKHEIEEGDAVDETDSRRRLELHARVAAAGGLGMQLQGAGEFGSDAYYHTVAGAVVGLPLVELRRVASLAVIGQLERLPAVAETAVVQGKSGRGSASASGAAVEPWRVWQLSLRALVALLRECAVGGAATAMKYMRLSQDGRRGVVVYAAAEDGAADGGSGVATVDDEDAGEDEGNQKLRASVAHACLHAIGTLLMKPPRSVFGALVDGDESLVAGGSTAASSRADGDSAKGNFDSPHNRLGEGADFVRLPVELLLWTMQAVVLPLAGAKDTAMSSRYAVVQSLKDMSPSIPGGLGMLPGGAEVASEATSLATRVLANAAPHLRDAAPEWFVGYWIEFVRAMSEDIARWGTNETDQPGGELASAEEAASVGSGASESKQDGNSDAAATGRDRRGDSLPAPPSQRGAGDVLERFGIEKEAADSDAAGSKGSKRERSESSRLRAGSRASDISSVSSLEGTDGFVAAAQNLQNLLLVARAAHWLDVEAEEDGSDHQPKDAGAEEAGAGGAASGKAQGRSSAESDVWNATWAVVRESCPATAAESLFEAVKVFDNPPPPSPRQAALMVDRKQGGLPVMSGNEEEELSEDAEGSEDSEDGEEMEDEDGETEHKEGEDGCVVS